MSGTVVFYKLGAKFVDSEGSIPEDSGVSDVLYYTLAVGHHTGIMDCFNKALECSEETYTKVMDAIKDEAAHHKLKGLISFTEIEINKSHVPVLYRPLMELIATQEACEVPDEVILVWLKNFMDLLEDVQNTASVYLMGRLVE